MAEIDQHAGDPIGIGDELNTFLKLYPDHERAGEVVELKRIADACRLRNQMTLKKRFSRPLSQIEQKFYELTDFDSPTDAGELESMIAFYGSIKDLDQNSRDVLDAAKAYMIKYRRDVARQTSVDRPQIEQALLKAQTTDDSQVAKSIYQWIVKYYADKPWAQDLVAKARAKLE